MQTGVSLERQLTKSANVAVTYLNSRGVHAFYTNFVNANAPGALPPGEILYQYQSAGMFKQNQLIVNSSVRMGTKLTLFGYYVLNYANSDTSGPTYMPSDPLDPALDYGRASFDYRHRFFMGGTVGPAKGFRLSPFLIASSGPPFNITTGSDLFGDAQFNSRPAFATCTATSAPNVVQTKFGCFNVAPAPGEVAHSDQRRHRARAFRPKSAAQQIHWFRQEERSYSRNGTWRARRRRNIWSRTRAWPRRRRARRRFWRRTRRRCSMLAPLTGATA